MHVIYVWRDPRSFVVRYVGMTNNLKARYFGHMSGLEPSPRKNSWFKEVKQAHLIPLLDIIDNTSTEVDARRKEAFWIHFFRNTQPPLTNRIYPASTVSFGIGNLEVWMPTRSFEYAYRTLLSSNPNLTYADIVEVTQYPETNLTVMSMNVYREDLWWFYTMTFARRCIVDRIATFYRSRLPGCEWSTFGNEQCLKSRDLAYVAIDLQTLE